MSSCAGTGCCCVQSKGAPVPTAGSSSCLGSPDCSPFLLPSPPVHSSLSCKQGQPWVLRRGTAGNALPPRLRAGGSSGWGHVLMDDKSAFLNEVYTCCLPCIPWSHGANQGVFSSLSNLAGNQKKRIGECC